MEDRTKLHLSRLPHATPKHLIEAWLADCDCHCHGVVRVNMFHKNNAPSTAIVAFERPDQAQHAKDVLAQNLELNIPVSFAKIGDGAPERQ